LIAGPAAQGASSLWDVVERLRSIYCGTTGYDVAHIFVPEERRWLREVIETERFRAPADPIDPMALLDRLTQVEAFERFLQRTFPGKTRFSIEGLDTLVPILDEAISEAAESGIRRAFIAMAHRGRLNVMAHVLGKPYEQILAEFKDPVTNAHTIEGVKWSGDVKYHLGASRAIDGGEAVDLVISMPPNPSHLEAIDPVLEGMARAAGSEAAHRGAPVFNPEAVLPILIHGDAAFPGQGIVAETLNLHRLAGYHTGGTIHHREQPDRIYDRGVRFIQHAVCERPGPRVQDSDLPCERARSRSRDRGHAAGVRLPRGVQARRADRPGRLPAPRPQRRGRARIHAACRATVAMHPGARALG
jgi:2-oxoglutarate dehydrogenase E1 component